MKMAAASSENSSVHSLPVQFVEGDGSEGTFPEFTVPVGFGSSALKDCSAALGLVFPVPWATGRALAPVAARAAIKIEAYLACILADLEC